MPTPLAGSAHWGLTRLFSYETLVKYGSMLPRSTGGFGEFGNQAMLNDWT